MAGLIYGLCAATASMCAFLLLNNYRRSRSRLLLWSGLCFIGLALNNFLLVVDRLFLPLIDLSTIRLVPAFIGIAFLIYGLVCEKE